MLNINKEKITQAAAVVDLWSQTMYKMHNPITSPPKIGVSKTAMQNSWLHYNSIKK